MQTIELPDPFDPIERVARKIFEHRQKTDIGPLRWESDPSHWLGMALAAVEEVATFLAESGYSSSYKLLADALEHR